MNIGAVIAGIALGFLSTAPRSYAGGVVYCYPNGYCRSQPYFTPPIIPVGPPVVQQWSGVPDPKYPLAPPFPPGMRPSIAAPYPPLSNLPQYQEPPSPPPVAALPPPHHDVRPSPPPPRNPPRKTAEEKEIESSIMDFCDAHPDEAFCGRLGAYLRKHPQVNPQR
jgi:hypothetical protein